MERVIIKRKRLQRLIDRGVLEEEELERILRESENSGDTGSWPEEVMIKNGIAKHEVLLSLAGYYKCPFVEYDESVVLSRPLLKKLDMEELKGLLWVPLSASEDNAEVVAYLPGDELVIEEVKSRLHVRNISFRVALPYDIIRIIEHNQDVNPSFPLAGARTPLALVRTFLADRRSLMACQRTDLAKARTGLAFIRTGASFIAIALLLLRVVGTGYMSVIELLLFVSGLVMTVDGLLWYIPVRRGGKRKVSCTPTGPIEGATVLTVLDPGDNPVFARSGRIEGAELLREEWSSLSPVMRRRFLASDRTDLASERTLLACYRTEMARARTGLAFTRTGSTFVGLGIGLLRQFSSGPWIIFDLFVLIVGATMALEGFFWYFPGRRAGREGLKAVRKMTASECIWDFVCPAPRKAPRTNVASSELLRKPGLPGIWATTGLALERTVLAERRNVMARLRTIMARSRTGMAFIRTGISTFSVGLALQLYFGAANISWTLCNIALMVLGVVIISDGLLWHVPGESMRNELPYCFGDMEISVPDYGRPNAEWGKVVFTHDEV